MSKIMHMDEEYGGYRILPDDTGWKTLSTGVTYRRLNGFVYIRISGVTTDGVLGTLPEGYRPANEIDFLARHGFMVDQGWIMPNGTVNLGRQGTSTNGSQGFVLYPLG